MSAAVEAETALLLWHGAAAASTCATRSVLNHFVWAGSRCHPTWMQSAWEEMRSWAKPFPPSLKPRQKDQFIFKCLNKRFLETISVGFVGSGVAVLPLEVFMFLDLEGNLRIKLSIGRLHKRGIGVVVEAVLGSGVARAHNSEQKSLLSTGQLVARHCPLYF